MRTSLEDVEAVPDAPGIPLRRARSLLLVASTAHLITDGLVAAIYPLFPLIANELSLSYSAVGSLRTALVGAGSLFQLPVGYASAWIAETTLLGAGTLWMGLGFAAMAIAAGFWQLLALTLLAGVGSAAQHPSSLSSPTNSPSPTRQ